MDNTTATRSFNLDDMIFPVNKPNPKKGSLTEVLKFNLRMQGFKVFVGPFAVKYKSGEIEEVLRREDFEYKSSTSGAYLAFLNCVRAEAEKVVKGY